MGEKSILFTTPTFPYPTLPANDSLTDAAGQRFTKGDGMFTLYSHSHCFANHILAQNINVPSVLLEYPRWEDFTREVEKGYDIIGISAFPPHLDNVLKMCEYIRAKSPQSVIMLGSYAAQAFAASYDAETQKRYVDHVILGEGVKFLREYLGEEPHRPISQRLMPRAGAAPPFLNLHPQGNIGFLITGLGCIGGCDFCSTTAMFDKKRIEMLSPRELVEHIKLYHEHFPEIVLMFLIEEDHFRFPEYLNEIREYWLDNPSVIENLDIFYFGSIDYIGEFAKEYGWDALGEIGAGTIFIGVESKYAGDHGYEKRDEVDARMVFDNLHSMGVRTVGAWICGWDFHHHANIYEDLNYLVSLKPTYQQLTRLSPFPGTELWTRMKEEGRVYDVPWEDVHFWSGSQKNVALEPHETLNLTEYGYDLLYKTWGPCLLRRLEVTMNGYEYCMRSANPVMREHKSKFFKKQSGLVWLLLQPLDRFAPNGVVRRRVRKADERFRQLFGEPTAVMKAASMVLDSRAIRFYIKEMFDPLNRHPKEEPCKKYIYDKKRNNSAVPYRTERKSPSLKTWMEIRDMNLRHEMYEHLLKNLKHVSKSDEDIDNYIVERMQARSYVAF